MKCYYCNSTTKIVDSRDKGDRVYRRRQCIKCNKRVTTYEKIYIKEEEITLIDRVFQDVKDLKTQMKIALEKLNKEEKNELS